MQPAQVRPPRPGVPPAVKGLRLYFAIVGRVLPGLAAKTFIRVFCTPVRHSLKPPHRELLARAEKLSYTVDGAAQKGSRLHVAGYRWPSAEGSRRILLLHGWSGKAADFYKLVPALEQAGYQVDALDMPAHGASGGKLCSEVDMERALHAYLQAEGPPFAIVAHSLGAAATVLGLYGQGRPTGIARPERLVLLTHPVILDFAFRQAFQLLAVPEGVRQVVYQRLKDDFQYPIEQFSLLNLRKPLPTATLTIHVPNDEEAPAADTAAFIQTFPQMKDLHIPDGDHARIMRHPVAIQAILDFLA